MSTHGSTYMSTHMSMHIPTLIFYTHFYTHFLLIFYTHICTHVYAHALGIWPHNAGELSSQMARKSDNQISTHALDMPSAMPI